MRRIKLKQTHKYDFIQGYEYVQAKTGYKNELGFVYSDHNIRVVYKDENNVQYSLFETIKNLIDLEWFDEQLVESLETNYYLLQSGEKYISTMFYNLLTYFNSQDLNNSYINVSEEVYLRLASVIISRFKNNWNDIYNSYIKSSYNPLETYNINETIKENYKRTKTNNDNESTTNTSNVEEEQNENKTKNKNENNTLTNNSVKENTLDKNSYAFNSANAVPTDKAVENGTISDTAENNTKTDETLKGTNNNTIKENSTKTKTNTNESIETRNADDNYITREKKGNFNTSKQTLIEQELKLRKYDFMLQIMQDIDKVLVSQIY